MPVRAGLREKNMHAGKRKGGENKLLHSSIFSDRFQFALKSGRLLNWLGEFTLNTLFLKAGFGNSMSMATYNV